MKQLQQFFADLIDAFRPADGPPPRQFLAFIRWALKGTEPVILVALALAAPVAEAQQGDDDGATKPANADKD